MGIPSRHSKIEINQVSSTEAFLGDEENNICRGLCDSENDTNDKVVEIAEVIMKRFHTVKKTNINEREFLPKIANSKKTRLLLKKGIKHLNASCRQ